MPTPLISVFTCSYNKPGNVAVAVSSILRQTVPDFEYFILEASDDGITRGIIHNFNDPRVTIIEETNHNESYLKNKYLPRAQGKYIAFLSDNNIMMTNCFLEYTNMFNTNAGFRAGYHGAEVIYTDNKRANYQNIPKSIEDLGSENVIFERSLLDELGKPYFNEHLSKKQSERDFVLHLSQITRIYPMNLALHIEGRLITDD